MRVRAVAALMAANAFWLMLAVGSRAGAQDYGPPPAGYANGPPNGPNEQVIVQAPYAPTYRVDHPHLNVPIENVSLSLPVHYGDLDLRTREGAHALRMRIRQAVGTVCGQLIDMYPVGVESDAQCFRDALATSMARADAAIQNARSYPPGRYRDVYYSGY
ncbi:MAG TPA: UrcA family protein [Rhizomicrobium sp.]|nr:UrcA family protein [Rhizomicrobium sp.]